MAHPPCPRPGGRGRRVLRKWRGCRWQRGREQQQQWRRRRRGGRHQWHRHSSKRHATAQQPGVSGGARWGVVFHPALRERPGPPGPPGPRAAAASGPVRALPAGSRGVLPGASRGHQSDPPGSRPHGPGRRRRRRCTPVRGAVPGGEFDGRPPGADVPPGPAAPAGAIEPAEPEQSEPAAAGAVVGRRGDPGGGGPGQGQALGGGPPQENAGDGRDGGDCENGGGRRGGVFRPGLTGADDHLRPAAVQTLGRHFMIPSWRVPDC